VSDRSVGSLWSTETEPPFPGIINSKLWELDEMRALVPPILIHFLGICFPVLLEELFFRRSVTYWPFHPK